MKMGRTRPLPLSKSWRHMQVTAGNFHLLESGVNSLDIKIRLCLNKVSVYEELVAGSPGVSFYEWQTSTKIDDSMTINVDRMGVSSTTNAILVYKAPAASLKKTPMVHFRGEAGIDRGALFKEFAETTLKALVMDQVEEGGPLFEGSHGHRLPVASKVHLMNRMFQVFGKALAHSLLHGGPGVKGLSPALKYALTSRIQQEDIQAANFPITVEDIPDPQLQELLRKVGSHITA